MRQDGRMVWVVRASRDSNMIGAGRSGNTGDGDKSLVWQKMHRILILQDCLPTSAAAADVCSKQLGACTAVCTPEGIVRMTVGLDVL